MTKRKQMCIAVLSVLALLCACVCGAFSVAADEPDETISWQETEDGQFLYRPYPYGEEDCVQILYIGDGTDVTVPATFGGEAFDVILFTDASAIDFGRSDSEQAQTWRDKARAASDRYLNLTFEEGPTGVKVTPGMYPGSVRATSVTLPKSVTGVSLYVEGLTAVSVPEDSALTTFSLYNVPEGWEHPSLTVIDLTGATGLARVWIGRDEWGGDCFAEGSVLKLPTEFKDVQILRDWPSKRYEKPYLFIDNDPMSLTVQYADGSERAISYHSDFDWHVTEDGQFLYRFLESTDISRVQVVYIGDDTDVTVPAAYDGRFPYLVWLTNDVEKPSDVTNAYLDKIEAAAGRYLNLTFDDGPINVWVSPNQSQNYVRAHSVNLPTSAVKAQLKLDGATGISVPQVSFLKDILIANVLDDASNPQPTVIDLTGSAYLERVWISRGSYTGACFAEGSVIKLPITYWKIPVQREAPVSWSDPPFFYIDYDPMPLTIRYTNGDEIVLPPIEPDDYIMGDTNIDGEVNMKDVLALRLNIASLAGVRIPLINRSAADVDGDGQLTMKDVLALRKIIAYGVPAEKS